MITANTDHLSCNLLVLVVGDQLHILFVHLEPLSSLFHSPVTKETDLLRLKSPIFCGSSSGLANEEPPGGDGREKDKGGRDIYSSAPSLQGTSG